MTTDLLLATLADMIERGHMDEASPHPRDLLGQPGAADLTRRALDEGVPPQDILRLGLMKGMAVIGEKFRDRLIYVPDVLLAARAMKAAMEHLRPYFHTSSLQHGGVFILGTVHGDLHDIGKRLVAMIAEGAGYEIVDLGTDVRPEAFLDALAQYPAAAVGLSALLTTTMMNMRGVIETIKRTHPQTRIIVGGAPLSQQFATSIGADAYAPDPYGAVDFLDRMFRPEGRQA